MRRTGSPRRGRRSGWRWPRRARSRRQRTRRPGEGPRRGRPPRGAPRGSAGRRPPRAPRSAPARTGPAATAGQVTARSTPGRNAIVTEHARDCRSASPTCNAPRAMLAAMSSLASRALGVGRPALLLGVRRRRAARRSRCARPAGAACAGSIPSRWLASRCGCGRRSPTRGRLARSCERSSTAAPRGWPRRWRRRSWPARPPACSTVRSRSCRCRCTRGACGAGASTRRSGSPASWRRRTGLPVADCLRRRGPATRQVGRDRSERLGGPAGAVALRRRTRAPRRPCSSTTSPPPEPPSRPARWHCARPVPGRVDALTYARTLGAMIERSDNPFGSRLPRATISGDTHSDS